MRTILNRILLSIAFLFSSSALMAGTESSLDEKIYTELLGHASFNVVFIVIAVIFCGLIITLVRIDRKVSKLEKEMKGPKA